MNEMALKWFKSIGKEQIQTFQDNFATSYNISMCLLTVEGEPLTVWSNESLICYRLGKLNPDRCMAHRKKAIETMLLKGKPIIDRCYTGLSLFLCPVFYKEEIIAFFMGGMVSLSDEKNDVFEALSVKKMDEKDFVNILNLLTSIVSMLSFVVNLSDNDNNKNNRLHNVLIKEFSLSERELSIVDLLIERKSNNDIAKYLFISEKTVKTHVSNILRKMNAKNRTDVLFICKELESKDQMR